MFLNMVVKRCLLPAAVVLAETKLSDSDDSEECLCRPSELPIYTPESVRVIEESKAYRDVEVEPLPGFLENSIKSIRKSLNNYTTEIKHYEQIAWSEIDKKKESIDGFLNYLRQEDNTLPKAGAIGIGALTGFIFGLRGGLFKRTLYATTGGVAMAAVCYPKQATDYGQTGLTEMKKYLTIAYNFAYGVKKDDPPLELPSLPKLPSSASEAWDIVKNKAVSFVSGSEETVTEVSNKESVTK